MKAEHRKELETNTLADKMGHMVQRVKTGRRSTYLIYVLVAGALVVGLWFLYVTVNSNRVERSNQWLLFDDGSDKNLAELASKEKDTAAGKAARLQRAWFAFWELGTKRIGSTPAEALHNIEGASTAYKKLMEDCVDDPLYEPQAMLGYAVCTETKAIMEKSFLDDAAKSYKAVLDKYPETTEGKFAKDRLSQLNDKVQRAEIETVYEDLRAAFKVQGPMRDLPLPKNHPPIIPGDKK